MDTKRKEKVPQKGTSLFRFCLIVVLVPILAIVLGWNFIKSPTIHSCEIYSPSRLSTVMGIARSLKTFVDVEGAGALLDIVVPLVKSEVLNVSPYDYSSLNLEGKKLLMLGGGYLREFMRHAKILGVELHLVDDPKMQKRSEGFVKQFISVEGFGRLSITHPDKILEIVKLAKVDFDGVFTLVEDQGPLVSYLAEKLNLPGNSYESSNVARNKYRMRQVMQKANLPIPSFYLIESEADLEKASKAIPFPSFLKPVYGVAASYASKVTSLEHLKEVYKDFQKQMNPTDHQNSIYYYGSQMILEEMLDGPEIQLELMLYKGELVFHCFSSEYSPKRQWLVYPVNLTQSQKDELLSLAYSTVKAIGLSNGVVHIEMFYSSKKGAQIIEVNNRLSRGFLPSRFSHQLLFGEKHTDYFGSVIMLALGLKPPTHERTVPPLNLAIFLDNPSLTGWETEGGCSVFFGASPKECLDEGIDWNKNREN